MKIKIGDIVSIDEKYLHDIFGTTSMFKKNRNGKIIGTVLPNRRIELDVYNDGVNTICINRVDISKLEKVNINRNIYKQWEYDRDLLKDLFNTDLQFKKDRSNNERSYIFCNRAIFTIISESNNNESTVYRPLTKISKITVECKEIIFSNYKNAYIENGENLRSVNLFIFSDDTAYCINIKPISNTKCLHFSYTFDLGLGG